MGDWQRRQELIYQNIDQSQMAAVEMESTKATNLRRRNFTQATIQGRTEKIDDASAAKGRRRDAVKEKGISWMQQQNTPAVVNPVNPEDDPQEQQDNVALDFENE